MLQIKQELIVTHGSVFTLHYVITVDKSWKNKSKPSQTFEIPKHHKVCASSKNSVAWIRHHLTLSAWQLLCFSSPPPHSNPDLKNCGPKPREVPRANYLRSTDIFTSLQLFLNNSSFNSIWFCYLLFMWKVTQILFFWQRFNIPVSWIMKHFLMFGNILFKDCTPPQYFLADCVSGAFDCKNTQFVNDICLPSQCLY